MARKNKRLARRNPTKFLLTAVATIALMIPYGFIIEDVYCVAEAEAYYAEPQVTDCEPETIYIPIVEEEPEVIIEEEPVCISVSDEEIDLIALVTMAEAEGECEEGKRLVIDTILNRVDSDIPYWPDTIAEVIYQKHQFTSMWNGRVDRCYVREDIRQLVIEELVSRTNTDVVYFTAGKYGKYGTPLFQVGGHYFSGT